MYSHDFFNKTITIPTIWNILKYSRNVVYIHGLHKKIFDYPISMVFCVSYFVMNVQQYFLFF